jgi:hypothetical protein
MQQNPQTKIADYKNIILVLGLINLMWIFAIIWSFYGFAAVLVLAATFNHLITRLYLKFARQRLFGR